MFARPTVFLSHSQRDADLRDKFLRTCGLAGITGIAFEFDVQSGRVPFDRAAADIIKEAIQNARALFVLIGPNVVMSQHTANWVSFEVGVAFAHTYPVPIWVFEDLHQAVDFPVPALNHHALFDPDFPDHWDWIREVMEEYGRGGLFRPRDPFQGVSQVCAYPNCRAVFETHYPPDVERSKCPSCRQALEWRKPEIPGYRQSGPFNP